jgi:hypothetical protein
LSNDIYSIDKRWSENVSDLHVQLPIPEIETVKRDNECGAPVYRGIIPSMQEHDCCNNVQVNEGCTQTSIQERVLEAYHQVKQSGIPNFLGNRIPVYSKLNIQFFRHMLGSYHDCNLVEFLNFGFPVSHNGTQTHNQRPPNHKGAREFPSDIDTYLERELKAGSVLGPFHSNPLGSKITFSPLNTVPKRDSTERRVIVDLSFPQSAGAVNDGIDKKCYLGQPIDLTYPTVDDFVEIIKDKGRGCLLYKRDLRRFYRQIPVDPGDIHLLGYSWKDHIFLDRVLPMGMRSACFIAQRITNAISYILQEAGYSVLNYIDDLVGAEKEDKAQEAFEYMGETLQEACLEETISKQSPPAQKMYFLGVC